jgi:predicted hydrocarbon binding protein
MKEIGNPFFIMPGSALLDLREELELIEDKAASDTLERYGYRAGVGLIKTLKVKADDLQQLGDMLPQIWMETGLSRINHLEISEAEIKAGFEESLEAAHGRKCDFTRGYLAGIVSTLTGRRYQATEIECASTGAKQCIHVLRPMEEQASPKAVEGKPKHDLERGYSYLIESEDPYAGFDVFVDHMEHGAQGMCIVREYPEKLSKRFELRSTPFIWLSYERDIKYAREPTNIPLIYSEVKNFLDNAQGGILLISGLEYLITQNNFIKVLKFIQLLNENVAIKDALLLLSVSPQALNSRDIKILERELRVLKA